MRAKGARDPEARARAHMRAARKYYKRGDLDRASAHYRRAMSFGTSVVYVSLRHGHDAHPIKDKGSPKTELVISDRSEAEEAMSSDTSLLATIVPCNPLHPLGAFMGPKGIETERMGLRSSDYTHRVLSRWIISEENHTQALELHSNVGLIPMGRRDCTTQQVNYAEMTARDASKPKSRIGDVAGPRVYADAWVFPRTTLFSDELDPYRTSLVFCPVPDQAHALYRESVAWATYTAMYAAQHTGSRVVILPMLHEGFDKDVRLMLERGTLPDGSKVPELGLKVIITGSSRGDRAAPRSPITLNAMGVLGYGENDHHKVPRVDEHHVIVDPAGLPIIRKNTPANARQLSGAIYKFLNISEFPPKVQSAIKMPGQAAYCAYDVGHTRVRKVHVIHVVGPDFRNTSDILWHDAISALKEAYASVIREAEALPSSLSVIRVPLISGGVFSGKFAECVPELTARAVIAAFREHGPVAKEYWLCTYGDKGPYERALQLADSVMHRDYKREAFPSGHATAGIGVKVSIKAHEFGTVGYAADLVERNPRAKVGVMVAGNSGRPAGAIGDPLAHVPTIKHDTAWRAYEGHLKTQEESVVAEWLYGEYPANVPVQERAREALFRSTICGLWGQTKRQSTDTIQGVDYTSANASQYADAWVVRDAKLRHRGGSELRATLVFVAGPNAKTQDKPKPGDYGSMWSTTNKRTVPYSAYKLFRSCVEASVRAGLVAMHEAGVTHALVARVSCGVYAGTHKDRINEEFVDLVKNVANGIAHIAPFEKIVIVDKSPHKTRYGVKPDRKRDPINDTMAKVTIEKTRRSDKVRSMHFEDPGTCPACSGESWDIDDKGTMWVCKVCRTTRTSLA